MSGYKIDSEKFYNHIQHIYEVFGNSDSNEISCLKPLDAFVLIRGKYLEDNEESKQVKTSGFHEYILGYDFADSLIFFSPKTIYFVVASKKKIILQSIEKRKGANIPDIEIILKANVEDNTPKIKDILENILKEMNKSEINLGYMKEEKGVGKTVEEFYKVAENMDNVNLVDTPLLVDEILQIKDEIELKLINISGKYSCQLLDYLNKSFENAIEEEKSITHEKISENIKKLTEKESFNKKFIDKNKELKVDPASLEIKYLPVIQSGGKYTWDPFQPSDSSKLSNDIIICKSFATYKEYNSQVIRTFMIDSSKAQQTQYKILLAAFDKMIVLLKDAVKKEEKTFGDIYKEIKDFIISKDESLTNSIPECMGYGIGIEQSNENLRITENCKIPVQNGMAIFIYLCLDNLNNKYMMQLGDTVCINENGEFINFTEKCSKGLNDIHYELKNNSDKESEDIVNEGKNYEPNVRVTRHMDKKDDEKFLLAEKRKEHQEQLLKQKNEEFKRRLKEQGRNFLKEEAEVKKKDYSNLKCFDNIKQFPPEVKQGKIYLSPKHFTVFLPIFSHIVPFHIGLIKNTSKSEDNNYTILRINFVIPISGADLGIVGNTENPVFIREISYKFKDSTEVQKITEQIKEMTKAYRTKEQENKEKEDLVEQEKIIIKKEKKSYLSEISIKPPISSKKCQGVLEAHVNGFRFVSSKGERVDIIYKNIKHAFLQTCESELIVLIHFNLKNPILVGKKKVHDIQFYKEVGSQADDLNIKGRGNDYDEYELELKEQKKKENMNKEFIRFTKSVEALGEVQFDLPFRELEFNGVPFKSNVTLFPTQNCIISLSEPPFFVITINEIEIIYFERVSQSLRNFDMAFIFKDLSRPIKRITAIPMENLDMLKTWADENDIFFGEGLLNMNWQNVINTIKNDPEDFVETGCWNFLAENASDEEEEEEGENADPEYEEEEIESSESDYDDDDEEEIESEGEDEGDSALSEEGKSWGSLNKEAARSDKEHNKKKMKEEEKFKKNKNKNKKK